MVHKCIDNITLTIPVSFNYWSGRSQILFILSTSVHGPNNFAKNLNLGQNLQVRSNGLRFKPKFWTELRRRYQWKSSTPAEWDITFCSCQQRDWVTWRKERLTRAQAHPPYGLPCVWCLSCTGMKTASSCVIVLPLENVFLVESLSFWKHLFRTLSSSRMNGFEPRSATESVHRAINRVRISFFITGMARISRILIQSSYWSWPTTLKSYNKPFWTISATTNSKRMAPLVFILCTAASVR